MKRLLILFALVCVFSMHASFAQEICNNGRDDDNDGFIDCYDTDCAVSTFCKGFYLGDEAMCEATPPAFPKFTMALDFASPNETTNHLSRMAIGDLNRDGKPEIITMNRYTDEVFILNGADGTVQKKASVPFDPNWEVAIANIDNDDCGEIFFFGHYNGPGRNDDGYYFFAYDCNLNLLWRSEDKLRGDPINYGLADFDGDGKVELYAKDEIFDAHTGVRIVKSTASSWSRINGGPIAVDMLGSEDLELVIGCAIYSVNLGNRTKDSGSLTLEKRHSGYYIRNEYNATSVADYNLDGHLDILASGSTDSHGDNTTIFFWDVHNDVVRTYSDPIPGTFTIYACPDQTGQYYKDGWKNGTGRINIGDLDGDGQLNISYVSGKYLYALDENLQPLSWSPKLVNEETSGHTGCTLFDFNGDGKSEIVYRDERFLYIINGIDGSIYNQQACISRTNREYPIVADVDADGSTELCVTCGYDDAASLSNFCNLSYSRYSHVRVFKSASDPWVPARRVWNQHGYFNVNVNDDLTIPERQQKHHLVFSSGSCTEGPNRPLNTFLNQTPFLNTDGCPTYKSPNLGYVENSLQVNPPTCPGQRFTVSFQITNRGDIALSGNVPISFYNGNPLQAGTTKLGTVVVPLANLEVGDIEPLNNISVDGPGTAFTLFIVLNDAGTSLPTPIALPNTNFLECDYGDNILSAPVNPGQAPIAAAKIKDNIKCVGSTSPDNGAVRAFIPTAGGGENTSEYTFYWSIGTTAKPVPADYTGAILTNIPDGVYTVYAVHKTVQCQSTTTQVTVGRVNKDMTVTIDLLHGDDNCVVANGSLRAIVNDHDGDGEGDAPHLYEYAWYEGNDIFTAPQVSVNALATNLKARTYTVVVSDPATGCQTINSMAVPDQTTKPVVAATATDIICSSANSGAVAADVGGVTAGYTFRWYRGNVVKPSADYTGATVDNLATGNYTVVATADGSQCASDPVTITVSQTQKPVITASAVTPMTSCDNQQANGSATVSVSGSSSYVYEWFRGQNTLGGSRVSTQSTATGLRHGIYTVKVTDSQTGCFETAEVTIDFEVVTPNLILAGVNGMTNCTTPNGSITVNVSLDTPADYIFHWYEGTQVKAAPDFSHQGNTLSGLPVGTYTVQAVHRTKHCVTAPVTASVKDNTPTIQISLNSAITVIPSDCTTPDGVMQVTVSAPGNTAEGFDVRWYYGAPPIAGTPVASHSGVFTSQASGLSAGVYTVVATNRQNGCDASQQFNLPFADTHSLTLIGQTDVTTCIPDNTGQITVELHPTPLPAFSEGDYDILLYRGMNDTGNAIETITGVAGTASYSTSNTLTPGYYTLVAISHHPLTAGCKSAPVLVEIQHDVVYPQITATQIDPNTNCEGATANGSIRLDIDGDESTYSYQWYEGASTAAPVLGTQTSGIAVDDGVAVAQLPSGFYTVKVVNTTATSTGCAATATFFIDNRPPVISVADADIDITDVLMCSRPNGAEVHVTGIRQNGTAGNIGDYTFAWFDANEDPLPDAVSPNTTPSMVDIPAGTYYLQAKRTSGTTGLACATAMVEFQIEDKTIGSVDVNLNSIVLPTRCLQPANRTGELHAEAIGNSTTGYTYAWYAGTTAAGPILSGNASLTGVTIPLGEQDVTFTLQVLNNSNDCVVTESYVLPLEVATVEVAASAKPLTWCSSDNGEIFATVSSGGSNNYDYHWFRGTTTGASPDFVGKQHLALPAGQYTIVAVDRADGLCSSMPQTVVVEDLKQFPSVTAVAEERLTICDPLRPDGAASASVDGNIVDYRFDWFAGTNAGGSPIYSGPWASALSSGTYTVIASHSITGCSASTQVVIEEAFLPVALPDIHVLSHVTSCVFDNGALEASVDGNSGDYIFHWYHTAPGSPADTTSAHYRGQVYTDLSPGTYYVSATSKLTGCISGPANNRIDKAPVYPAFDFKIQPATCQGEDGIVAIYMTNDVDIASVEWEGIGVNGPTLQGIPPGRYRVTVSSVLGCESTREIEVGAEIRPFNGVSRNGDGHNDIFHIDCIDQFPTNIVRIFNRAGTLVYEAEGYDNIDIYFDGKSNKGISVMGSNLPDGTYFYVIDKRNGTRPIAGYLEIVN